MASILRLGVGLVVLTVLFAVAQAVGRREGRPRKSARARRTDQAWWFFVGTVGQWLPRAGILVVVAVTASPFVVRRRRHQGDLDWTLSVAGGADYRYRASDNE